MFFFPIADDKKLFDLLTWPLPPRLLPWLSEEKGLGIWVLPDDDIDYYLFDIFKFKSNDIPGDDRHLNETAFFDPTRRIIVIHQRHLREFGCECTLTHEIGHAVDYLYYSGSFIPNVRLIHTKKVQEALLPFSPINKYCEKKQKLYGDLSEQFACSFSAYFKEKEPTSTANNIQELGNEFINFMQEWVITPFK